MTGRSLVFAVPVLLSLIMPAGVVAQGCMPIRFVSPAVGGRGDAYLERGSWRSSIAYRRLWADEFFVGTRPRPDLAPKQQPIIIRNNTVDLGLTFAITDRTSLTLNVPFLDGSISMVQGDNLRHRNDVTGVGDLNVRASRWIWNPHDNPRGNAALGAGLKAPTGSSNSSGTLWRADGSSIAFPTPQAIQPGEGGWSLLFQAEGFRHVARRMFVYASGVYTANPRKSAGVLRDTTGLFIGVPDTYSARAGASVQLFARNELSASSRTFLSASIGWREDATTRSDLFGGADMFFRAPAIVGYVDNGLALVRGRYAVSVSVPVRAYQNYRRSDSDIARNRNGGGNLASHLLLIDVSRRQ